MNPALSSPCPNCSRFAVDNYPECANECNVLNSYLIYIGETPHEKPERNLHLLYPPVRPKLPNNKGMALCTPKETSEIVKYLNTYKKKTKMQNYKIAAEVGCPRCLVNMLLRGSRQRVSDENKLKFWRWMGKI